MVALDKTPLTAWHKAHSGEMVELAGWEMPLHYAQGINAEHLHTREYAGVFDFSHMGKFMVHGKNAAKALSRVVTCNIDTLKPGRCRYGFMLNPDGGIKGDLIFYRLAEDRFMLVGNAHTATEDFETLQHGLSKDVALENISKSMAKIDLQGPASFAVLEERIPNPWKRLPYYGLTSFVFDGAESIVSRTGYTGELGVEIYLPWDKAVDLWTTILADNRVCPVGLGARDTLRLEVGLPLYGYDLDPGHTPAEAGFTAVLTSGADYIGKENAYAMREKMLPLVFESAETAPFGSEVFTFSGEKAGTITSCLYAPSLHKVVALAYVDLEAASLQSFLVGSQKLRASYSALPFYKKGSARITLI